MHIHAGAHVSDPEFFRFAHAGARPPARARAISLQFYRPAPPPVNGVSPAIQP